MSEQEATAREVAQRGWSIGTRVVPPELLDRLRHEFGSAVAADHARRPPGCLEEPGRMLSLLDYGGPFWDLAELPALLEPFDALLGPDCIYYTMTSSVAPPRAAAGPCHVDSLRSEGVGLLSVGAIVMLDDYTEDNGGVRFLAGSTGAPEPDGDAFQRDSELVVAPAGSICWFDPCIWHGRGPNHTDDERRAVVIGMVRSWMKQRLDHPAMLADRAEAFSPGLRQKLGFDSRVPSSAAEYYRRGADRSTTQPASSATATSGASAAEAPRPSAARR